MDSKTNTNTTHLQGIGRVPAKPAGELEVGDVIIYNYGYRSTVCGIIARGKTQIIIHTASHTGGFYQSVINRSRLVGIAQESK